MRQALLALTFLLLTSSAYGAAILAKTNSSGVLTSNATCPAPPCLSTNTVLIRGTVAAVFTIQLTVGTSATGQVRSRCYPTESPASQVGPFAKVKTSTWSVTTADPADQVDVTYPQCEYEIETLTCAGAGCARTEIYNAGVAVSR